MDQIEALAELFKNYMTRTAFAAKYKFQYYHVTEAIEKGQIATYLIDGKVYINVDEALSVLQSRKRKKVVDLFA
jgi:hypothetical protein